MNVLLHICCAPCALYPVELLRGEGHAVNGLFYNPNIHPYAEYLARLEAVLVTAKRESLEVAAGEYEIEKYFQGVVDSERVLDRCPICWWMRLEKTAKLARERGFDAFTTTLLGSPYQNHNIIRSLAEDVSTKAGVEFLYRDFRTGFREAHRKAKDEGIYCQKYCGCLFSEREKYLKGYRSVTVKPEETS